MKMQHTKNIGKAIHEWTLEIGVPKEERRFTTSNIRTRNIGSTWVQLLEWQNHSFIVIELDAGTGNATTIVGMGDLKEGRRKAVATLNMAKTQRRIQNHIEATRKLRAQQVRSRALAQTA